MSSSRSATGPTDSGKEAAAAAGAASTSKAKQPCGRFSLDEILSATEGFSDKRVIGIGGFGKVYKGAINNGSMTVAVKRSESNDSGQGKREFETEIETLTELRHSNIVSLIGYCDDQNEFVLVYEYINNKTLAHHLHGQSKNSNPLTWIQRLDICIGAGQGLHYLHTGKSMIHRDVKSTNILLDKNLVAKVSDFGLAKHLSQEISQNKVSSCIKGTLGYMDPSVFLSGQYTMESDVYAFGVVLLEMLSERPAVCRDLAGKEQLLADWAREKFQNGETNQIVAENLMGKASEASIKIFVEVAIKCCDRDPQKRPTMLQVLAQLELAKSAKSKLHKRRGLTHQVGRWLKNAFQARVIPSEDALEDKQNAKILPAIVSAIQEDALEDRQNDSILPAVVPAIQEDALEDTENANILPAIVPAIQEDALEDRQNANIQEEALVDRQNANILPAAVPAMQEDALEDRQNANILPAVVPAIKPAEPKDITRDFSTSCLTGHGLSGGSVSDGFLMNAKRAVIKSLNQNSSLQEFLAQVPMLSDLEHENLALGLCVDGSLQFFAYENDQHGSLQDVLHGCQKKDGLSWTQRIKIAVGAAEGLQHIHDKELIHCNIKSSNILLLKDDTAKIGVSCGCGCAGQSQAEDVYRFGVVILELLTGCKPFDPAAGKNLVTWATPMLRGDEVHTIIDARLNGDYPLNAVAVMAAVAASCLEEEADSRPNMNIVLRRLHTASWETKNYLVRRQQQFTKMTVNILRAAVHAIQEDSLEENASILRDKVPAIQEDTLEDRQNASILPGVVPAFQKDALEDRENASILPAVVPALQEDALEDIQNANIQEDALEDRQNANILPAAVPDIQEDALEDRQNANILPAVVPAIGPAELKDITRDFSTSCLTGHGLSGGSVSDGFLMTAKRAIIEILNRNSSLQEFLAQVSMLSDLEHENVALGLCMDGSLQFFAYENDLRGSLHDVLHGRQKKDGLSWTQRIKIAVGAAEGLQYIHDKELIHCNIKSSNILLLKDDTAKIGVSCGCGCAGQSQKEDVYRFGVVILELLTGCKPFDPAAGKNLVTWATPMLRGDEIHTIIDARLNGDYPLKAVAKMAEVAASCLEDEADYRPDMNIVLRGLRPALWETKIYLVKRQQQLIKMIASILPAKVPAIQEDALEDRQNPNILSAAVPAMQEDAIEDGQNAKMFPAVFPAIQEHGR